MQLSDIHLDLNYDAACNFHTFCRVEGCTFDTTLEHPFGQYGCDAPSILVHSALQDAVNNGPYDLILFTGDMGTHLSPSAEVTLNSIANASAMLLEYFPTTPILPVLGNDDSYPDYVISPDPHPAWLEAIGDIWRPFFSDDEPAYQSFLNHGYYRRQMFSPAHVYLCLNTVLWSPKNSAINGSTLPDPGDQLHWIETELKQASDQGYFVSLVGHISPGVSPYDNLPLYQLPFQTALLALLRTYSSVITAMHFGHLHRDDFRVLWDSPLNHEVPAASTFMLSSSISLTNFNNPSYRTFTIAKEPMLKIIDYSVRYLNLYQANKIYHETGEGLSPAQWENLYDFRQFYDVPDLSPGSFVSLSTAFEQSPALFLRFNGFRVQNYQQQTTSVNCAIREMDLDAYNDCLVERAE